MRVNKARHATPFSFRLRFHFKVAHAGGVKYIRELMKFIAFFLMVAAVLGIGGLNSYFDYKEPESRSLDSWVTFIDWKSKNHGMPLILLTRKNGTKEKFHHTRIILAAEDLKIGDHLVKARNSKICEINGEPILCLK